MRTGRPTLIRDINRSLVLNLVRERGPISRADVSRISGLSPSTVTGITAALLVDGYVLEDDAVSPPQSRAGLLGRPATRLRVDPTAGHVVGIKATADNLTATVTDLEAAPKAFVTIERSPQGDSRLVADLFAAAVDQASLEAGVDAGSLLGVGVGLPGIVDPETGRVRRSPLAEWDRLDLVPLLSERLGLPVHLDNDVNTLTIAEQLFGASRGLPHFMVVTIGRGIGMGAVVNGTIYRGARGAAGELGHVIVDPDGMQCWCGRRGCLETIAAEPALIRDVLSTTGQLMQPNELTAAAGQDARITRILENAGRQVGWAIGNIATVLGPERVVISGEGVRLGDPYLEPLQRAMEERTDQSDTRTELVIEPWGDEAWARGAAALVLRELFHPAHLRDDGSSVTASAERPVGMRTPARAGHGGSQ